MIFPTRFFAIAFASASLCGCTNDVVSSSHVTRADAADIVDRGWIPAVLPGSSRDIRESHNLDINVGHGTFVFEPVDAQSFEAALVPIPAGHPTRARSRDALESSGYSFYSYEDFDIAVNWTAHKGEFWLGPSQ